MNSFPGISRRRHTEDALRESEERFRQVTENIQEVVWLTDAKLDRMLYVSPAYLRLSGRTCDSLLQQPRSFLDAVHPDDRPALVEKINTTMQAEVAFAHEYRITRPDGEVRWVWLRGFPVRNETGQVYRFAGIALDITQQVLDQQQLRLQSTALSAAANAIFITDRDGLIQWANAAFCRLSGYELRELINHTPRILKSGQQNEAYYERMWQTILAGEVWSGEVVERRKNGELYTVHQTVTPLRDATGQVTHFIAVHEDITARKEFEARIAHLAFHDPLTGLPNRAEFQDRLGEALARAKRAGQPVAVHFLDLDRFKVVNDTLGHAVGDALLVEVGRRLRSCLRATDIVARLGGDEFAILQTDTFDENGPAALARKVLQAMAVPVRLAEREIHTSPSIGITLFPEDGADPKQLMQNADMAMYLAKKEGRNNFQFFTPALNVRLRERMVLEADLHNALTRGQFVLHYQPQLDLRTRRLVGMEALIRWQHPERGLLGPGAFVDLAEDTGLIRPITRWVLEQACAQNARWQSNGFQGMTVAVNISAASLKDSAICRTIKDILHRTGLSPHLLELEVTESMMLQDAQLAAIVAELERLGIALAIDDFGTGYSSLSYLRRLPLSKLKIDQSFVRGIPGTVDDEIIAQAIIDLGHALGRTVIAEGVETEEQFTFLREKGCDQGQGYLFSRPVPAESFEGLACCE